MSLLPCLLAMLPLQCLACSDLSTLLAHSLHHIIMHAL